MNYFQNLISGVWAIEPQEGLRLLAVAKLIADGKHDPEFEKGNIERNKAQYALYDIDSDSVSMGSASMMDSVMVINIQGAMFKRAEGMDRISGGAGTGAIKSMILSAKNDPNVKGIVLSIDSPGGSVDGTEDLTGAVSDFAKTKPILSFVDGRAASAAYWVASASDEVMLSGETATIGSIGVVMTHQNISKALEASGVEITYVTNSEATKKILAPPTKALTDELFAEIQHDHLNPTAAIFRRAVKSGRGEKLSIESGFETGKMFQGKEAIRAGLADSIGTFDSAVKRVIELSNSRKMAEKNKEDASFKEKLLAFIGIETVEAVDNSTEIAALNARLDALSADNSRLVTEKASAELAKTKLEAQVNELHGRAAAAPITGAGTETNPIGTGAETEKNAWASLDRAIMKS